MSTDEKIKNISIIFCPPLSLFPNKPEDISEATKINCPFCKKKMWFSKKKKQVKKTSELLGREILLTCMICLENMVKKDTSILKDCSVIQI